MVRGVEAPEVWLVAVQAVAREAAQVAVLEAEAVARAQVKVAVLEVVEEEAALEDHQYI
jgi:hypothetical protein